jgi:hypothetical protein
VNGIVRQFVRFGAWINARDPGRPTIGPYPEFAVFKEFLRSFEMNRRMVAAGLSGVYGQVELLAKMPAEFVRKLIELAGFFAALREMLGTIVIWY